jgi:hypothetical protein
MKFSILRSKLLNFVEQLWVFDPLNDFPSVLDMGMKVFDSGVEDVR